MFVTNPKMRYCLFAARHRARWKSTVGGIGNDEQLSAAWGWEVAKRKLA